MTTEEAIMHRHSVRTFVPEVPDGFVMSYVKDYISALSPALPGEECRLALIEKALDGKVGTYGVVKGAQCCVAVAYDPADDMAAVNAGMVAEGLVLGLTARGMGSVWLGATFSASDVARSVTLAPGQKVAAVIPFGIPAAKESLTGRAFAFFARSSSRKPFAELFTVPAGSPFRRGLELMRLAPSATNRQGWRAVEKDGMLHFFCSDKSAFGMLDMGIGLCHFAVGAPAGRWISVPEAAALMPGCRYVLSRVNER